MELARETVRTREHEAWVDNLRVAVIAGVVVLHSATAYLGGADWYYMERTSSDLWATVLAFPATAGAMFGLAPLYLIAGWFAVGSMARHGSGAFVRGRALRLGLPLLAYILLIDPLASSVGRWGMGFPAEPWAYGLKGLEAGPMWFVGALLVFSLGYAVLRRVRPVAALTRRLGRRDLVVAALVLAGLSLLLWQRWPLSDAEALLNLRWGLWPQGAVLFGLGVLAAESGSFRALTDAVARRLGWLALGATVVLFGLAGIEIALGRIDVLGSGRGWESVVLAVLYGVISIAWSLWLVAWARRRLPWRNRLLGAAGRASYATYVLHPLVLTGFMAVVVSVPVPPEVKFLLVSVIAVPLCFGVGHLLVRTPGLSRIL